MAGKITTTTIRRCLDSRFTRWYKTQKALSMLLQPMVY